MPTNSYQTPTGNRRIRPRDPVRIQVAVQGGGARLSLLLGAMQAIEEAERQRSTARPLQVTRLAGTSAGALAAALLAVGYSIADVRAVLFQHRAALDTLLRMPSKPRMAWRGYRGKPFIDLAPIREALARFFVTRKSAVAQRQLRFSDLAPSAGYRPLVVVASDVVLGTTRIFSPETTPDTTLVEALMASIAVPFLFQTYASHPNQPLLVDGGLCENLPVEPLLPHVKTDGPIVAIALVPPPAKEASAPTTGLAFAQSLLDTAIRHAVTRARQHVPDEQVIEIPTDLGTFQFSRGLSEGLEKLLTEAKEWTESRLQRIPFTPPVNDSVRDQRTLRELQGIQEAISHVYTSHHHPVRYFQASVRLTVRIGKLREVEDARDEGADAITRDPDTMWHRIEFWPGETPISCLRMNVKLTDPEDRNAIALRDTRLQTPSGDAVPYTALLARDHMGPTNRMFLYFPTPPLVAPSPRPPDGPYFQFRNHQSAPNAMDPLFAVGSDTIGVATVRASEPVPVVRIIVLIPQSMQQVQCCDGRAEATGARTVTSEPPTPPRPLGRPMTPPELAQLDLHPEPGYYPIGWIATDVPPDTRLLVTLRYPAAAEGASKVP
jgi:predicted acylesterase/phospholipase RssA